MTSRRIKIAEDSGDSSDSKGDVKDSQDVLQEEVVQELENTETHTMFRLRSDFYRLARKAGVSVYDSSRYSRVYVAKVAYGVIYDSDIEDRYRQIKNKVEIASKS